MKIIHLIPTAVYTWIGIGVVILALLFGLFILAGYLTQFTRYIWDKYGFWYYHVREFYVKGRRIETYKIRESFKKYSRVGYTPRNSPVRRIAAKYRLRNIKDLKRMQELEEEHSYW